MDHPTLIRWKQTHGVAVGREYVTGLTGEVEGGGAIRIEMRPNPRPGRDLLRAPKVGWGLAIGTTGGSLIASANMHDVGLGDVIGLTARHLHMWVVEEHLKILNMGSDALRQRLYPPHYDDAVTNGSARGFDRLFLDIDRLRREAWAMTTAGRLADDDVKEALREALNRDVPLGRRREFLPSELK